MEMCNGGRFRRTNCGFFLVPCHNSNTQKPKQSYFFSSNIIEDPMVAMDAPMEIFMIAIKEPLCTKGDLYDCNHRAPIVSPSNSVVTM